MGAIREARRGGVALSVDEALAQTCPNTTVTSLREAVRPSISLVFEELQHLFPDKCAVFHLVGCALYHHGPAVGFVSDQDAPAARIWLTLAAEMGMINAQIKLGHLLMEGLFKAGIILRHVVSTGMQGLKLLERLYPSDQDLYLPTHHTNG